MRNSAWVCVNILVALRHPWWPQSDVMVQQKVNGVFVFRALVRSPHRRNILFHSVMQSLLLCLVAWATPHSFFGAFCSYMLLCMCGGDWISCPCVVSLTRQWLWMVSTLTIVLTNSTYLWFVHGVPFVAQLASETSALTLHSSFASNACLQFQYNSHSV